MISARSLSEDERLQIADLNRLGQSMRAIARKLGRHPGDPIIGNEPSVRRSGPAAVGAVGAARRISG